MSILVRFPPADVTTETYDESVRHAREMVDFPPDGLEYHVAFMTDEGVRVSEIWDSVEQFQSFGEQVMPLLAELGIELTGEPEIIPVHNIISR